MITANLSNNKRKAIYRRDGWECAVCGSTKYLQIHHAVPRSQGGTNEPCNLITLCSDCHAAAHGIIPAGYPATKQDVEEAIFEYLGDQYLDEWWPYNDMNDRQRDPDNT